MEDETVVCNRCSYHVTEMVVTNASTNKKHKFYYSMVQSISIGGDCTTQFVALCASFFTWETW